MTLEDVARETLILYPEKPRPSFADHVISIFEREGVEIPHRVFTMDFQTAIALVSVDAGISVVPASVGENQRKGVRFIPFPAKDAFTGLSVNYRIDNQAIHVKNFCDLAARVAKRLVSDKDRK